jgi:hypothetical protein
MSKTFLSGQIRIYKPSFVVKNCIICFKFIIAYIFWHSNEINEWWGKLIVRGLTAAKFLLSILIRAKSLEDYTIDRFAALEMNAYVALRSSPFNSMSKPSHYSFPLTLTMRTFKAIYCIHPDTMSLISGIEIITIYYRDVVSLDGGKNDLQYRT